MPDLAPSALVLTDDVGSDPQAQAVVVVLEGMHQLVRSHQTGWHEGPGSLVPASTWFAAVRRLSDDLLRPAADSTGRVQPGVLTQRAQAVADALYGEDAPDPLPDREPWEGRLLVVLGCGRSGTTWLERMLLASPDAGGVDGAESFLFQVLEPLWSGLDRSTPVCDRERLVPALRRFCDTVLEEAMAGHTPEAGVFIEKTPLHSLIVRHVAAVYPHAHYLHLMRDGRDVARSMSRVPFFKLPDPADAAALWMTVLRRVREAAPALEHYREVRYEDLVADPVAGVLELLAWAGLRHDDSVVPELRERATTRVSSHAGTTQAVGSGTWHALDRVDLYRLLGECGDGLVREGYATRRDLLRAQLSRSYWTRRLPRVRARVERALRLR